MRFINAHGTPAEIRDARGEHVLLLDDPLDCAPAAKAMLPYLGWGAQGDIVTLKYVDMVACVGRFLGKRDGGSASLLDSMAHRRMQQVW